MVNPDDFETPAATGNQELSIKNMMYAMMQKLESMNAALMETRRELVETRSEVVELRRHQQPEVAASQSSVDVANVELHSNSHRHPSISDNPNLNDNCRQNIQRRRDENISSSSNRHVTSPLPTNIQSSPNLSYGGIKKKLHPLPEFSGRTEDWPGFEACFRKSSDAYQYSDLENNFRLLEALKGPAKEAVDGLLIYPENVSEVIRKLRFEFGRPEMIVKCQLDKIMKLPDISESNLEQIIPFANKVSNMVTYLRSCGSEQHLGNPILLEELVKKLPNSRKYEWAQLAFELSGYATIADFSEWIGRVAEFTSMLPFDLKKPTNKTSKSSHVMHATTNESKSYLKCSYCQKDHVTSDCKEFQNLSVEARWDFVKCSKLCFGCLRKGHGMTNCRRKKKCMESGCQKYHSKLLHSAVINNKTTSTESQREEHCHILAPEDPVLNCEPAVSSQRILLKTVPISLFGPKGNVIQTLALIDEGSTITMMNKSVAERLGLRGERTPLVLKWLGEITSSEQSEKCSLQVSHVNQPLKRFQMKNVYIVNNMKLPKQYINVKDLCSKHSHLKNLPLVDMNIEEPEILIGLDHLQLLQPIHYINGKHGAPSVMKTKLGYAVFGPITESEELNKNDFNVFQTQVLPTDDIEEMVTEYFHNDNQGLGIFSQADSKEVIRARNILVKTSIKVGNRYETGLLWTQDDISFPPSYGMAKSRLLLIEKKMTDDPVFGDAYKRAVQSFIDKGYARQLSPEEAKRSTKKTWYLPHFGVTNPNKPGKVRVVYDAAARSNGVSLNDMLLKGPDQYQSLLGILFRFREGQSAVCGDIAEMFPQIHISKDDRQAQRFLWRFGDKNSPIAVFEMVSMIFGAKCSPSSAQFIKNMNALRHEMNHPDAVKEIIENHYVDDFVSSFVDEATALEVSIKVKEIHAEAGFNLRNFVSNSSLVAETLNGNTSAEINMNVGKENADKILGMYWMTAYDSFTFKFKYNRICPDVLLKKRFPTKRELLGLVMSVYDPIGFLADRLIAAKLLLQDVWKIKLSWNDTVPADIAKRWYVIQDVITNMESLRIPRCHFTIDEIRKIELHCFVDASESALAVVCYFRIVYVKSSAAISFVIGKTKCCPLKLRTTIPRCELQAAVIGSKIKSTIVQYYRLQIDNFFFWTDSRTVLYWIKSDSRKYKQYVSNRILTILENSHQEEWYWVPTKLNPADDATRAKLKGFQNNRWIEGPQWLEEYDNWPNQPDLCRTVKCQEEMKNQFTENVLFINSQAPVINPMKFSNYLKLLRVTAWILRYKFNLQNKIRNLPTISGTLKVCELRKAELLLCKNAQQEYYKDEYSKLINGKSISKSSKILKLLPYIDENKLLRVFGRIDNSYLPIDTKRPIILPEKHALTNLIVSYYHNIYNHQNSDVIICEIRRKFWVNSLRGLVKKIGRNCNQCKISRAECYQPIMGQLPKDRLTPFVRPFTYTGIDYFGPIIVTIGRRSEKRWIALFTCLTIRAIHLEIAEDLSADSCILCVRNFINYRGTPVRIRSDNGTNFVGAKNEILKAETLFGQPKIRDNLSKDGIEWLFNTPGNPSEGGCWERMVKSVKRVLNFTFKGRSMKVETLRSVLCEAMNIINSRPLTHVPINVEDNEPLTPNHFILGTANRVQTPSIDGSFNVNLRKQWRIAQQMVQSFWKRWVLEFLPTLTGRTKWYNNDIRRPIKEKDVVIICDDGANKNVWEKGVVVSLLKDRYGVARKAEVRCKNRILTRPISKLALLDIME